MIDPVDVRPLDSGVMSTFWPISTIGRLAESIRLSVRDKAFRPFTSNDHFSPPVACLIGGGRLSPPDGPEAVSTIILFLNILHSFFCETPGGYEHGFVIAEARYPCLDISGGIVDCFPFYPGQPA